MAPPSKPQSLVDRMPDPDDRGTYANMDKDRIEQAVAEMHKGGRDSVVGLIDMLVEPGKGDDVKPHYALHVLAVHVCKGKDDRARAEFARTVASQLAGRPKGVQRYLIRQLQVAGGPEVADALGKALLDPDLCEPAAQALLAIGAGAAEQFRAALPKVKGAGRLTVLQALGVLRDAKSANALRAAAGEGDRDVRLAAVWGLANIGDAASAGLILQAAGRCKGWERIQATKCCFLLAERLLAAGKKDPARKLLSHLRDNHRQPSQRYIRQAAERALAGAG